MPLSHGPVMAEIALVRHRSWGWRLGGKAGLAQEDALGRGFLAYHPNDRRRLVSTEAGLAALRRAEAKAAA